MKVPSPDMLLGSYNDERDKINRNNKIAARTLLISLLEEQEGLLFPDTDDGDLKPELASVLNMPSNGVMNVLREAAEEGAISLRTIGGQDPLDTRVIGIRLLPPPEAEAEL